MQVECSLADLGMAEQNLDDAQVGAAFQHVGGEAVSKQMRRAGGSVQTTLSKLPRSREPGSILPRLPAQSR